MSGSDRSNADASVYDEIIKDLKMRICVVQNIYVR